MRSRSNWPAICGMVALLGLLSATARAQGPATIPAQYRHFFARYADSRSLPEKALNLAGLSSQDVGRSFALIAGVTRYPQMKPPDNELAPAAEDLRKLTAYLSDREFFDEIVVLKDGDMTYDNLAYFLQTYFPERLRRSPKSRFLFAYSGHGVAIGKAPTGYLLTSAATSKTDIQNGLNLSVVRTLLDNEIEFGYNVLVLLNACHSGAFLRRSFGGALYMPRNPGAHAITAGGARELSWSDPAVGTGSVFFEKLFAGLGGQADTSPPGGDGLITVDELTTYLKQEVRIATDQHQNPLAGDLSSDGSLGGFFFLNRGWQAAKATTKGWNPQLSRPFGSTVEDLLEEAEQLLVIGQREFNQSQITQYAAAVRAAVEKFRAAADQGSIVAMNRLGDVLSYFSAVRDDDAARQWWEKAAAAGNVDAMVSLGTFYMNDTGSLFETHKPNQQLVRQLWEKAAVLGSSQAMVLLGRLLEAQEGASAADIAAARVWWEKAAAAGNQDAKSHLGELRTQEAERHRYEKAAAAGDAQAMTSLGHVYRSGLGVPVDPVTARRYYEKAASAGNANAMTNLGYYYKNGEGVAQDYVAARRWFLKAATSAKADVSAMYYLGMLYKEGKGGKRDYKEAMRWFREAALAGDEDAPDELAKVRDILKGPEK